MFGHNYVRYVAVVTQLSAKLLIFFDWTSLPDIILDKFSLCHRIFTNSSLFMSIKGNSTLPSRETYCAF